MNQEVLQKNGLQQNNFSQSHLLTLLSDKLSLATKMAGIGTWEYHFATNKLIADEMMVSLYDLFAVGDIENFTKWLDKVHEDDRERVMKEFQKTIAEYTDSIISFMIVKQDGSLCYIKAEAIVHRNDAGEPVYIIGTSKDVTDITQAKLKIQESEQWYHRMFDQNLAGFYETSLDGIIINCNQAFASMLKYNSPSELIGTNATNLYFDPSFRDEFVSQILDQSKLYNYEGSLQCKDGSAMYFLENISLVTDIRTGENVLNGTIINITERQKDKQQLIATTIQLQQTLNDLTERNKDLEQFAYIISHNLRSPVANILGLTEILNDSTTKAAEKEEINTGLIEAVKKLDDVVKDLNNILQVKKRINDVMEMISFTTLVKDIELSIKNLIESTGTVITHNFSSVDNITTIKSYMYSIFYNLILNSIKYKRPDVTCTIHITSELVSDKVRLLFIDNGMGIDLKKRGDELFGLYKRFHYHVEGKGIGLFMVKTQVESLGGKISVMSALDTGSTFVIEF